MIILKAVQKIHQQKPDGEKKRKQINILMISEHPAAPREHCREVIREVTVGVMLTLCAEVTVS